MVSISKSYVINENTTIEMFINYYLEGLANLSNWAYSIENLEVLTVKLGYKAKSETYQYLNNFKIINN
jgi:hypothetical protein